MRIETLAVHAGHSVDPTTGAVAAPIQLSTTFERAPDGSYPSGFVYSRSDNPNRQALEQAMAALEGGEVAAAFGSGLAATAAVFQSLRPGDHVIAPSEGYHGALKQMREIFVPWGLAVDFVDMTDLSAVRAAVRPETRLIWTETPSNPQLKITDLAAVAEIAHEAGALCACDNTWAPIVQQPLALGLDLVVHSSTKYISGHSDVTGGVVIARAANDFCERLRAVQGLVGGVPSPFDCWLALRGVRTLPVAHAGALRKRRAGGSFPRQPSARRARQLPRARLASGPRNCAPANERVQRDAFLRGERRTRSRHRRRREGAHLHPRD